MVGCWSVSGTHVERYKLSTEKKREYRELGTWYTWYQRPGTNHPHHLGTDVTFFLPRPQHLTKSLLLFNIIYPPPSILILFCVSCYGWCLFVCTWCSCWCVLLISSFGIVVDCFVAHTYDLLRFFFTWWPAPTDLQNPHPPTLQGFCTDAHRFTLKCWWVVGDVGWTTFRDSPYESDFILVIQVRAIIACLLIFFITQSGRCILRPPRLLLCCFPLHRRQISSDITSSPLSSTATKHKLL